MKIPLIIASDFSGMLEGSFLFITFLVTLVLSSVAAAMSFSEKSKEAAWKCAFLCAVIFVLQALVLIASFTTVSDGNRRGGWPLVLWLLVPVVLAGIAFAKTRRRKPNQPPDRP